MARRRARRTWCTSRRWRPVAMPSPASPTAGWCSSRARCPARRCGSRSHQQDATSPRVVVVEVVEPSPHRVAPPCPELATGCGGCGWQHAAPDAQLQWKADIVADALRRTAKLPDADVRIGGAVQPVGLPHQHAARGRGRRARRPACGVPATVWCALDAAWSPTRRSRAAAAPCVSRGAEEVSLRVSVATGEATALVVRRAACDSTGLAAHVAVGPERCCTRRSPARRLRVSARVVLPVRPAAAELLVRTVRERAATRSRDLRGPLLDAYGGIGLFAATLGAARGDRGRELAVVVRRRSGQPRRPGQSCSDRSSRSGRRSRSSWPSSTPRAPASVATAVDVLAATGAGAWCWSAATRCRWPATPRCSRRTATATPARRCSTCSRTRRTSKWSPASTAPGASAQRRRIACLDPVEVSSRASASEARSMPYSAIHFVRAVLLHSTRSERLTMRLPPSPSSELIELAASRGVVTTTMRRMLLQQRPDAVGALGQFVGDARHPHPVDPALQHRRLAGPPRGVHEHQRLAPAQVVGVRAISGLVSGGDEVVGAFPRRQLGHEAVGVEVGDAHLVARGRAGRPARGRGPPR